MGEEQGVDFYLASELRVVLHLTMCLVVSTDFDASKGIFSTSYLGDCLLWSKIFKILH